jgi:hypothetical protein
MDKPYNHIDENIAGKRGFALLITLSVLAVLMALTGVLLGYFDTVRKDAGMTKAMIQGNLYYADIRKIIKGFKEKKILFTTLYQMPIPLSSPDGRFNVLLQCRPRANGVNINWLGKEEDPKMAAQFSLAQELLDRISQRYNLEDSGRLEELIQEEMSDKKGFIQKDNNRLFQKNGMISFQQFKAVLQRYQFETDDQKVFQIPWEKYFVFGDTGMLIDGDYLSAELIALLFDIDFEIVQEEWAEGSMKLKDFVEQRGGTYQDGLYAKEFVEEVTCSVQYQYQDGRYAFRFVESQGEVKNFEFNGKR